MQSKQYGKSQHHRRKICNVVTVGIDAVRTRGRTLRIARRRRCRRFLGIALLGCSLLLAGVVMTSPAHADQTSYLNDLHTHGIHDTAGGDAALVKQGWLVCDEVWAGEPPRQLAAMALQRSDTVEGIKGLTPEQAADFVGYAITDLCPSYYTNYRW